MPLSLAHSRNRRALAGGAAQAGAQAVQLVKGIISVPIILSYLGNDRNGLWWTIASAFTFLTFADLGLGNGLSTLLAHATGRDDRAGERRLVSSAFYMLAGVGAILLALNLGVLVHLPLGSFFGATYAGAEQDAVCIAAAVVGVFALNLPLLIYQKVCIAHQETYFVSLWNSVGHVLSIGCMLLVVHFHAGVIWLALAVFGAPAAANLMACIFLFVKQKRWLAPRPSLVSPATLRTLIRLGISFSIVLTLNMIYLHIDSFIISRRVGNPAVTPYYVPYRMFLLIGAALDAVLTPLWGAFGEARGRGDWTWIRLTTRRMLLFTLVLTCAVGALLVVFGPLIVNVWTRGQVHTTRPLLAVFAVLTILNAVSYGQAIALYGLGLVRQQIPPLIALVVIKIALAWLLAPVWGGIGVALATLVGLAVTKVPLFQLMLRAALRQAAIESPRARGAAEAAGAGPG